jgi:hypothetical protein
MSNVISNNLYVHGPTNVVHEFLGGTVTACLPDPEGINSREWRIQNWNTVWIDQEDQPQILSQDSDITLAVCRFTNASDPVSGLFKASVAKYHERGVRFLLQWCDSDSEARLHREDFTAMERERFEGYKGDLVITRFGEMYTAAIDHPDCVSPFKAENSGARYTDGPITAVFSKNPCSGDDAKEYLTEFNTLVSIPVTETA